MSLQGLFDEDVAEWLEREHARLQNEAAARDPCFEELGDLLAGEISELSPECAEFFNRNPDGSEIVADTGIIAFLEEWWWALAFVAGVLIRRGRP